MTGNNSYHLEVLVKDRKVTEYKHNGDVYIEGRLGSEYILKFTNVTPKRVEVVFSVDGLSVTDGKIASEKSTGYVVNGYGTLEVPGWTINQSKVAAFQFRPKGDKTPKTYVEELIAEGFDVDASNQGVIGCLVFPEKPYISQLQSYIFPHNGMPPDYSIGLRSAGNYNPNDIYRYKNNNFTIMASSGQNWTPSNFNGNASAASSLSPAVGTGFGEDKSFTTTNVAFTREYAIVPNWMGVIYYDTITNLKKKGIVIENITPNAFPGLTTGCYVPKNRL